MGYSFVLSGQGSEKVGMLRDVLKVSDYAVSIVKMVSDLTNKDFSKIILTGSQAEISDTHVNQLMIFMYHDIFTNIIMEKYEILPDFIMGHSLGQLCAYSVAGIIDKEEMIQFIRKRAEIINDQSIEVKACFVNCFGLTYINAVSIIKEYGLEDDIKIGLHNQRDNVVLAVTTLGREKIKELSNKYKFIVKDLKVARPYHTVFMEKYNEKLIKEIDKVHFKDAKIPVLLNHSCKMEKEADSIKAETKIQMVKEVFWYESLLETTCDKYIVLDPSRGQAKITQKIVKGKVSCIANYNSVKSLINTIKK